MKDYNPVIATVFGCGAVSVLGEKTAKFSCKKAMVVCGKSSTKNGTLDKALESLKAAGIEYIIYAEATPDAPDTSVDAGGDIAKAEGVDCLIGIGGGSAMDTAKAIAVLLANPGSIDDYLTDPPTFVGVNVPIILIPTTSGTGAECTAHGVIMDTANNRKPAVFMPINLAIVDPELTLSVPPITTATTGMDAFTHASEAITTNNRDDRSEAIALGAIRIIGQYLPKAVEDGSNIDYREKMMRAANLAGIALEDAGVHYGHSIADAFSAQFGTAHGLNCAWGSPELMKLIAPAIPEKVQLIGEALGAAFTGAETAEEIGEKTAAAIRALMKASRIPSIKEMGFSREKTVEAAPIAFESGLRFACPAEITLEITEKMFGDMYDNYQ